LCSKIRNIVLYDLAHIKSPRETVVELLSRLNTCHAFRKDSWRLGNRFESLRKASLHRDWIGDKRTWTAMTLDSLVDGVQGWTQLTEENERAKATVRANGEQLKARDSGGTQWEDSREGST
jgi:hypothetical protein